MPTFGSAVFTVIMCEIGWGKHNFKPETYKLGDLTVTEMNHRKTVIIYLQNLFY